MKISLNALKKYVKIDIPVPDLLRLIGSRLVEIEGTIDLSEKYRGVKVVSVETCEKIEGTHLSLCQVSDGNTLTQVVCGAPNVRAGMLTAWITPGSIVPATFGEENFRLDVRKLRGYESHGMLAAADELGFSGASHDGIVELDPREAHAGDDFAEVYDLNDIILDIENKSLTHRPDTFGLIGFAREVAGILGEKFNEPEILSIEEKNPIKVRIEDDKICSRYTCAVLDLPNSYFEASRYFTKTDVFLYKAGMRPVSPVVDLTNILMLETGQPLHAFDYERFVEVGGKSAAEVTVRLAREGETLRLLDGRDIELNSTDIVICSGDTPVALAGAMGGESTEIMKDTKKILLESATFSLYNLRKTQMSHGIFSEAITRFTKGIPASLCLPTLANVVKITQTEPDSLTDRYPSPTPVIKVKLTAQEVNSLLGTNLKTSQMISVLENVNFGVKEENGVLEVTAPSWRTDIHIREDIIEEIGRLLGYDNIPLDLPTRPFIGAEIDPVFKFKTELRHIMTDILGANEVLTYSFVSSALLNAVGEKPDSLYRITNSISPELQYFRSSITPSLLDKIKQNENSGFSDFTIYEINQVSSKTLGLTEENVPKMETHLSVVTLGNIYDAKKICLEVFAALGIAASVAPSSSALPYLEKKHSVDILDTEGHILATVGEIRAGVASKLKLKHVVSCFEIDLATLMSQPRIQKKLGSFSKFQSVTRDLTLKTPDNVSYAEVEKILRSQLDSQDDILYTLEVPSIFKKEKTDTFRNITFRITMSSTKKTLETAEISAIIDGISSQLERQGVSII